MSVMEAIWPTKAPDLSPATSEPDPLAKVYTLQGQGQWLREVRVGFLENLIQAPHHVPDDHFAEVVTKLRTLACWSELERTRPMTKAVKKLAADPQALDWVAFAHFLAEAEKLTAKLAEHAHTAASVAVAQAVQDEDAEAIREIVAALDKVQEKRAERDRRIWQPLRARGLSTGANWGMACDPQVHPAFQLLDRLCIRGGPLDDLREQVRRMTA